jgi:hypothetical protein
MNEYIDNCGLRDKKTHPLSHRACKYLRFSRKLLLLGGDLFEKKLEIVNIISITHMHNVYGYCICI